jgi:secreted trypsin-like serine protease
MLGKNDLNNYDENGAKNYSIREIILHLQWEWNSNKNGSFHGDIAVIVLNGPVVLSKFINQVNLPAKHYEPIGDGTIGGWGQSNFQERHATKPSRLKIPIVAPSYCLTKFPKIALIAWQTLFCAGCENQSKGACLGDSGGGFYTRNSKSSPWTIRGIVSGSILNVDKQCDVNAFQVYTNVALFVDWIEETMNETLIDLKNQDLKKVDFECE